MFIDLTLTEKLEFEDWIKKQIGHVLIHEKVRPE
jgi:hypothetical protein